MYEKNFNFWYNLKIYSKIYKNKIFLNKIININVKFYDFFVFLNKKENLILNKIYFIEKKLKMKKPS
jgi:hypothetical protein